MRLIAMQGYSSYPDRQTDKNSYIDGNGKLHRTILPHTRTTITITLKDMNIEDKMLVQSFYPNRSVVELTYWNDATNTYKTGTFYVPDIEYIIDYIYNGIAWYKGFTLELIEY